MAPHMQRDYRSAEVPNAVKGYSPRTTKHGEDSFLQADDVDISEISRKEDFFHYMGLQMKRFQCEYSTLDGNHTVRRLNVPNGVKLRDCSVVILGASCKICGKCFKCETDVNVHMVWQHFETNNIAANETRCLNNKSEECDIFSKRCELPTITVGKNPATKLQRKLRLTLKIGEEVIAQISMKRKYLKINRIDTATQTDQHEITEFAAEKKNVDEDTVPRIDLPVFDNSSSRCCTSTMHVVNSTNRYLVGNIVASEETKYEETTAAQKGSSILNRLTTSCATSISGECDAVHHDVPLNTVSFKSDVTHITEQYNPIEQKATKKICYHQNNNSIKLSPRHTNNAPVFNNVCDNSEKQEDSPSHKQSCVLEVAGTMVTVMIPVIVPIIVTNTVSPANHTEQRPSVSSRQQSPKVFTIDEQNSDDEVQEVLRIVRGRDANKEINHESPNRFEQKMLVQDASRNMIRIEQQSLHLLERKGVELKKKRRRVVTKSDTKSVVANDEPAKKWRKVAVQSNSENNNIVRSATEDRYFSYARELFAKTQNPCHDKLCISDNAKENVMMCHENINISSDVLRCYGINYCNKAYEINNNTETAQEPVSRFFAPCSGGMENRSNRPTVIDLVNDADE